jgi:hypothetical protein
MSKFRGNTLIDQLLSNHRVSNKNMKRKKTIWEIFREEPKKKRSKSLQTIAKPPTEAQENVQKKFGLAGKAIPLFKAVWSITQQYKQRKYRALPLLFQKIHKDHIIREDVDFIIDYPNLRIFHNSLDGVFNLQMVKLGGGLFNLTWERSHEWYQPLNAGSSEMIVFVINETKHQSHVMEVGFYAPNLELDLKVPGCSDGDQLHCWVFLHWASSRKISDGTYVYQNG